MATESRETVTINGQVYDALTGMPIQPATTPTAKPAAPVKKAPVKVSAPVKKPTVTKVAKAPAKPVKGASKPVAKPADKPVRRTPATLGHDGIHASGPQRSETLNRRVARKNTTHPAPRPVQAGRSMEFSRSARIAKFAPRPTDIPTIAPMDASEVHSFDRPAIVHPLAERLAARPAAVRHPLPAIVPGATVVTNPVPATVPAFPGVQPTTSQEIKNVAIAQALASETPSNIDEPFKKKRSHRARNLLIVLASIIVLVGAAYVTFMNLPVLSVSLASAQAGIKASYPSFVPDGYHLKQPITFNEGQVTLEFDANGGSGKYIVTQARSSWDSSAVLTNIVQKQVGDDYITTQDSGLTIYTYKGNAAWVNAGILYTIENDGTLSNSQVDDIATSL